MTFLRASCVVSAQGLCVLLSCEQHSTALVTLLVLGGRLESAVVIYLTGTAQCCLFYLF